MANVMTEMNYGGQSDGCKRSNGIGESHVLTGLIAKYVEDHVFQSIDHIAVGTVLGKTKCI